jgi:PAS domain S-box-containing protein
LLSFLLAFFLILAYLIGKRERDLLIAFDREKSIALSTILTETLREAMLEKDPSVFKRILDRATASSDDISVAILRPDGTIFYGDKQLTMQKENLNLSGERVIERGERLFFIKPLINEERCHKCHNPEERLRGFIITGISTEAVNREIRETEKRVLFFLGLLSLCLSISLALVLKKKVIAPLKLLENIARRLRDGQLSSRAGLTGHDEFGILALTFNEMAERLEASQKGLEEAVAIKTRQLEEEKDFSDAIFNNVVSGIMVLDAEGKVIRLNQAGAEILQLPYNSIEGRRLIDIYPECKEMLHIQPSLNREVYITLENGESRPIGFASSPLLDKDIEKGTIVVFRDLTEVKKLQAEIRKKHRFETMGKVISGVAHEIRNPIFAIQSIAQILDKEIESSRHQPLVQAMLKETKRMKNLVEELLLYSRPSRLNIIEIDVYGLLEELKSYLTAKKINIPVSLTARTERLRADRDKLIQVLLNILDNAAGAGSSMVDILTDEENGRKRIIISDDGEGIREDHLDRLFEPFFTTKKDGTGLGLAICKKIIEDHGGIIEVMSKGKGTTVIISLPA